MRTNIEKNHASGALADEVHYFGALVGIENLFAVSDFKGVWMQDQREVRTEMSVLVIPKENLALSDRQAMDPKVISTNCGHFWNGVAHQVFEHGACRVCFCLGHGPPLPKT